ncbi:MAG: metal ABC transporter permease [Acidimicrobiia bacterium]
MNLPLPYPFDRDYMQLALAAGLVVAACAPLIGAFLVEKQLSLLGDGLGHLAFAGVAVGLLLAFSPLWAALVVTVVGALALEYLRARGKASGDLVLALFFYGGIAAGAVIASRATAEGKSVNVLPYLFGSILTVTPNDVWLVVGLGAVIVLSVAIAGRALFAIVVDEEAARVSGLPVSMLNGLLVMLAAITIVAATQVVGTLLVAALMVLPVASGRLLARSFRTTVLVAVAVGIVSVVAGLAAARFWAVAPGGAIVLVAGAVFAVTAGATGLRRANIATLLAGPGH